MFHPPNLSHPLVFALNILPGRSYTGSYDDGRTKIYRSISQSLCKPRSRERNKSIEDGKRLPQKMACDPWPVTKYGCKNDTVLEAALVLVRARNAELIPACSNEIILLPESGAVPGIQGGSRERPLYSLRPPRLEPFKIHLWQIPANQTWNRTTWS